MVVSVLTFELTLPGSASLKEKRMVVRSLKDRLRHRFNVSVVESGLQDQRQLARLSVAYLSGDAAQADGIQEAIDRLVEAEVRVVIGRVSRERF